MLTKLRNNLTSFTDTDKHTPYLAIKLVFIALAIIGLLLADPYVSQDSSWDILLLNSIPILLLAFSIYLLSFRAIFTLTLTSAVTLALYYLHARKLEELAIPLSYNDFLMIPQFLRSPELMWNFTTWPILVGIPVLTTMLYLISRWERPFVKYHTRLIALAFSIIPITSLSINQSPLLKPYKTLSYMPWHLKTSTSDTGLIASLVRQSIEGTAKIPEPDLSLLNKYRNKQHLNIQRDTKDNQPDIILWLSEAFFDPSRLNDINGCDFIPHTCELRKTTPHGELVVPAYGGQTIRTEFEVLTGIPMRHLSQHTYPYLSLGNRKINSIAWYLKSLGYETTAIHTHEKTFYNRNLALPNLGFDRWIGKEDMENTATEGYYVKDSILTDNVIQTLANNDKPKLIFAISMQAHGPWGDQKLSSKAMDNIAVPTSLDEKTSRSFKQYLNQIGDADTELKRMNDYILQRKHPTIMLFFGDHLPGLEDTYNTLGFKNGRNSRTQTTDYLFISNYALKNQNQNLAAWQASTALLDAVQLTSNSQFAWFKKLYDQLDLWDQSNLSCETEQCLVLKALQLEQLSGPPFSRNY